MNVEDIISSGLLELYVAGLASEAEKQQVNTWRKQYPEVEIELQAIEIALEKYAFAHAVAPAASVKEKLIEKINFQPVDTTTPVFDINENKRKKTSTVFWKWGFAASVILFLGSLLLNLKFYNHSKKAEADLKSTKQKLESVVAQTKVLKEDIAVIQNKYTMAVSLSAQPTMPGATAKIYWITNTGEVMVDASNLPDAPAGKQYQFWAIVDGKPVSGGLLITNNKGMKIRMQKMKSFGSADAFAISLENEGGNPTPTKVVSMGAVSKI
ncbi:MAG: anti-sigma factor [Chitinophagaceae bacterium]|nr:anti-sigma factor [Chitinophagaceae bacterium]